MAVQELPSSHQYHSRKRGPMTKEEWEKQQSIVRRVYDPDTGRHRCFSYASMQCIQHFRYIISCRLVKGDGEIVEEIVSREQQRNINRVSELIMYVFINCYSICFQCSKQRWEIQCHFNKALESSCNCNVLFVQLYTHIIVNSIYPQFMGTNMQVPQAFLNCNNVLLIDYKMQNNAVNYG